MNIWIHSSAWIERVASDHQVGGSNPPGSVIYSDINFTSDKFHVYLQCAHLDAFVNDIHRELYE